MVRQGRRLQQGRSRKLGAIGKLHKDIEDEYLIWRIWKAKNISLSELKYEWSYVDLLKANAILDYQDDLELGYLALRERESKRSHK